MSQWWGSGFITQIIYSANRIAPPTPPSGDYLLETDNTPILLTTGEQLNLA
jgi:hypothetical protein